MGERTKEVFDRYHVIHHGILQQLVGALSCPVCYGHASLTVGIGLSCEYTLSYYSSPVINNNNNVSRGPNIFHVNQSSVYAMRSIGLGLSALEIFLVLSRTTRIQMGSLGTEIYQMFHKYKLFLPLSDVA